MVNEAHDRDAVVANVSTLVDKARDKQVPVIWVQHSSQHMEKESDGWQLVPELSRQEPEPLVHKTFADSFDELWSHRALRTDRRGPARRVHAA